MFSVNEATDFLQHHQQKYKSLVKQDMNTPPPRYLIEPAGRDNELLICLEIVKDQHPGKLVTLSE